MKHTTMSAAMQKAGFNAAESRLRELALDALKQHHRNLERALPTFVKALVDTGSLEIIALAVSGYLKEFAGQPLAAEHGQTLRASNLNGGAGHDTGERRDHTARPANEPSAAQKAAVDDQKKSSALTVFDRTLTHTGRRWGNVYYRELDSMAEDGDLAVALRHHIGSLRGDDRNKTIRELMTPLEFCGVIRKLGR